MRLFFCRLQPHRNLLHPGPRQRRFKLAQRTQKSSLGRAKGACARCRARGRLTAPFSCCQWVGLARGGRASNHGTTQTRLPSCLAGKYFRPQLHRLFQFAFSVGKRVRSETGIGRHPVSIAYLAIQLAQRIFSPLNNTTALMIGAGETVELTAQYLQQAQVKTLLFTNRTRDSRRAPCKKISWRCV